MTIWVMRQDFTPEQEERVFARTELVLPFENLPDLSQVSSAAAARKLIKTLHPLDPPEAITGKVERFWKQFSTLQIEDIIVVPLVISQQFVIATVAGPYHYEVGEGGSDIHLVPVRWLEKRIALSRFNKHKQIFSPTNPPMMEVTSTEARTAIRDHFPHSYNRFVKVKWLMAVFLIMGLIRMIHGAISKLD